MSGLNHLDIIWLAEQNMAVIYCRDEVPREFVAAAIILKGEDGTDLFIPYEGYVDGAPICFTIDRGLAYRISVLGFGPATETVELAAWTLNETLVVAGGGASDESRHETSSHQIDMSLLGFGERNLVWQGKISSEIGYNVVDFSVEGEVDYSALLSEYLMDTRQVENETFTAFYVAAVPRRVSNDEEEIGPALQLRPLHHFHFGLKAQTKSVEVTEAVVSEYGDGYEEDEDLASGSSLESAAIINRHGGIEFREAPEFILNMGMAHEQVDFVLSHGFQVFWRRQFETWSQAGDGALLLDMPGGSSAGADASFQMQTFSERNDLLQQGGYSYFNWDIQQAIIGDVVGVVFDSEDASIKLDVTLDGEQQVLPIRDHSALFIFMGDKFVPLTREVLLLPENLGVTARLQAHIDAGLQQNRLRTDLKGERVKCAHGLLERDELLQEIFTIETLKEIAGKGPFGPELMVYRDHILRVVQSAEMGGWMSEIEQRRINTRQTPTGRLVDTLQFETFCKAPQLAHALVFNESFRNKFHSKPIDPHSFRMPVLEYLMSKLFSDPVIDWAMRLKGESQAILWHLVLKRPEMVERLYELKLEPDIALNPFDDQVLSHVETALHDSSHISAGLIERRVIPIFKALKDDEKVAELSDFARALNFGADGKALSLGELSVCLAAVETAGGQWAKWREDAIEIFQPLVTPLVLEVPGFDEGEDFSALDNLNEFRQETGHLIERVVKELGMQTEQQVRAIEFLHEAESHVLLNEIASKLDLALKYHRDLSVGVQQIYDHFGVTSEQLVHLGEIDAGEWPNIETFAPQFQEPLLKRLSVQQAEFDRLVKEFAQGAQPDDELFHQTLVDALAELAKSLPYLLWLETGQAIEERVENVQKKLKYALIKVSPGSSKLRRSKVISEAVKTLIEAEKMGAQGWPVVSQSLDQIEKELPLAGG